MPRQSCAQIVFSSELGTEGEVGLSYVHHVPGRLRVRTSILKKNTHRADEVKNLLLRMPGISCAEVNELTGSVTVQYDASRASLPPLLEALRQQGCLSSDAATALTAPRPHSAQLHAPTRFLDGSAPANVVGKVAKAAAFILFEKALEHSVLLLLAEVL